MEFTPRISQILKILLANGGPIGKQEIAEELGVSKRTVQREFEYLELCIRKYNLKLVNYKGKGSTGRKRRGPRQTGREPARRAVSGRGGPRRKEKKTSL